MDKALHFQDGGHDVISHEKVLSPDECTRNAAQRCSAYAAASGSS